MSTRPTQATAIPHHCQEERFSVPRVNPTIAVTTGIIARNMLDFATPRFFMALTQREKATDEQRTARQRIGSRTCHDIYRSYSKCLIPFVRKSGIR